MGRFLILTTEPISDVIAGPAIRALELGRQLHAAGHSVVLQGGRGTVPSAGNGVEVIGPQGGLATQALARRQTGVLVEGFALMRYPGLGLLPIPLIVDLYDPFPLALLQQSRYEPLRRQEATLGRAVGALNALLRRGDFFLCASERQRDLWLGALMAAGRINPRVAGPDDGLRRLIDVVPFGVSPTPFGAGNYAERMEVGPQKGERERVILWGGGIYNWLDPLTLIRGLSLALSKHPTLRLVFMGTGHPRKEFPRQTWMHRRALELVEELAIPEGRVLFNRGWVAYQERGRWLNAADVGVSMHLDHLEARFAFRTRVLDYLWAGLPVLCTAGDHFGDLVRREDLGWVVGQQDVDGVVRALSELVAGGERVTTMRRNVRRVAREMTWDRVSGPLLRFAVSPKVAPDRRLSRLWGSSTGSRIVAVAASGFGFMGGAAAVTRAEGFGAAWRRGLAHLRRP